ncbi:MAG: carbon starvation protein A, partial [Muribaculaceae bacterium]|nr:carbon starvation protein A [Muribaculaceae bacterium]
VISRTTLGHIGALLAILGVVAAPITSGDTAFRSARLIISDMFKIDQKPLWKRFAVCLPLFAVGFTLTQIDFAIIWRYFAWCNQALAVVTLWAIFVWLRRRGKNMWVALVPALCMTYIITSYVFISSQFIGMGPVAAAYACAAVLTAGIAALAFRTK